MTTDLRTRLDTITLDPADASQANHDFLRALVEVAERATVVSKMVDALNGDSEMQDLRDALAKLESAK